VIGLVVVNLIRPGAGINANPATLDTKAIEIYTKGASEHSTLDFFLNIIPTTVVGVFADGEILQVLAQKSGRRMRRRKPMSPRLRPMPRPCLRSRWGRMAQRNRKPAKRQPIVPGSYLPL
jgi:hypothetical protein